ncbi:MAG: winged helix-turn-helix transcriptional regulator [Armatimonadetes bacterium]|nr:winged helix-turn-helix transcriptional regulator [Anaerolineae bacterium]
MADYIYAPPTIHVSFSLEPAFNLIESLGLLNGTEDLSGLDAWIYETHKAMSPELRRMNKLVFDAAYHAVFPPIGLPDELSYIRWLESQDALAMRDKAIAWIQTYSEAGVVIPPHTDLLADVEAYLGVLEQMIILKRAEKGYVPFDADLYRTFHRLLNDPEALKQTIISHTQLMWHTLLKPEWERKLPILQAAAAAFEQMSYRNLTPIAAVRAITGRDISGLAWAWQQTEQIVFIPSPHIGPYLNREDSADGKIAQVLFGVRLPEGSRLGSADLNRSELNVRLSALADDTRLRILELVATQGELYAQDIMTQLDLSQSATSRNLRQLTATGYLIERRRETAKCYSLNRERIDDTMRALTWFFRTR